jgi:hypothetical protein
VASIRPSVQRVVQADDQGWLGCLGFSQVPTLCPASVGEKAEEWEVRWGMTVGTQVSAAAGREGDVARALRHVVEQAIARVGRSGCWARPLASVRAHGLLGRLGRGG